jgi:hypothetical protein
MVCAASSVATSTRQANLYAGFSEGFENDIGERGAARGKPGDGVHVFFVHDHRAANGVEERLGDLQVFGRSVGALIGSSLG